MAFNHILLELKKYIFYAAKETLRSKHFPELYFSRVRFLIIKEKEISSKSKKYEDFLNKWNDFTSIYDFRGPDAEIV